MGLDTSHDCWHGPYSMFMRWREWLAAQVGIPLRLMQGFVDYYPDASDAEWGERNAIGDTDNWLRARVVEKTIKALVALGKEQVRWDMMKADPLWRLLNHSDCDGNIKWWYCKGIAERLAEVYRQSKDADVLGHGGMNIKCGCYDSMRRATLRFALGCYRAYRAREHVVFR